TVEDAQASCARLLEKPVCKTVGVHLRSRSRQDRRGRDQSETFVQRGFLQPFDAEAGLAPRLEFGTQSPRVASRTRQIQAWRFAPTDIADFIGNRVQLRNGVLASL